MKTKTAVDDALARLSRAIDRPWDNGSLPSYEDTPSPVTRFVNRWTKPAPTCSGTKPAPTSAPTGSKPARTSAPTGFTGTLPLTTSTTPAHPSTTSPDALTGRTTAPAPQPDAPAYPTDDPDLPTPRRRGSPRDFQPVEPPDGDYLFLAQDTDPARTDDADPARTDDADPARTDDAGPARQPDASRPTHTIEGTWKPGRTHDGKHQRQPHDREDDLSAPDLSHPGQFTPDLSAPDQFTSDLSDPGQFAPDQLTPGQFAPDQFADLSAPGKFAPDQFADLSAPDQFAPDQSDPVTPTRRRLFPRVPRLAAILAVLAGALLAGYLALPSAPSAPNAPDAPGAAAEPPAPISLVAEPPARTVTIDVQGKVRKPGLQHLPEGSRVHDAIKSSGGALPGTDTSTLNLARRLTDGEQINVGAPPAAADPATQQPLTNLNTAPVYQLDALPGVGIVTAQRIVEYRNRQPFTDVDQLRQIEGIGPTRFNRLKDLVTVN